MVGRVSRDGIGVLGNGVAVVTVLEEPVPCAADGVIADGVETEVKRAIHYGEMGHTLRAQTKATPQTQQGSAAWPGENGEM